MPLVLNEIRRLLKGFMALALIFVAAHSRADQSPAKRNFLRATWDDGAGFLRAPLSWKGRDWAAMALPAAGLFALVKTDPQLYPRLRGRQDWLDSSMPIATQFGDGQNAVAGVSLLWGLGEVIGADELAGSSASALESIIFCAVASTTLKSAFNANRPSDRDDRHDFFSSGIGGSPSFPSGHTLVAFALAESYGASYGRWWTYPLAACVGYSRLYLGVHWPSDIAAGAILGAALGHAVVSGRETHGAPRTWSFSLAPSMDGGAILIASSKKF